MKPKISIITACYNSEEHLEQTICSIRNQTYSNIEFIVVDGGSTDRTLDVISRYRDTIDICISEPDEGIYDAFNKGVKHASGELVGFLNSDDYFYDSESLEKIARAYESCGEPKVIYGDILWVNERNGYKERKGKPYDQALIMQGKMPPHPAMFMRREVFEEFGSFDMDYRYSSDLDLVIKVFGRYESQAMYLPEIITVFRYGGASTVLSNREKTSHENRTILSVHFGESAVLPIKPNDNMVFYKKWIEQLLFDKQPITSNLYRQGVRRAAIFGSVEMSLYIWKDMLSSGISVLAFLDNNPKRHGIEMNGVGIYPPSWLADHRQDVDLVIFAFEGDHETVVRQQIESITMPERIPCISWRELFMSK